MADQIGDLTDKLKGYRAAAARAEQNADRANDPYVRDAYRGIMRTWIYLAEELEREIALAEGETSMAGHSNENFVPSSAPGEVHKSR